MLEPPLFGFTTTLSPNFSFISSKFAVSPRRTLIHFAILTPYPATILLENSLSIQTALDITPGPLYATPRLCKMACILPSSPKTP